MGGPQTIIGLRQSKNSVHRFIHYLHMDPSCPWNRNRYASRPRNRNLRTYHRVFVVDILFA